MLKMSLELKLSSGLGIVLHDCPGFFLLVANEGPRMALLPLSDRQAVEQQIHMCNNNAGLSIFTELAKNSSEVLHFVTEFSSIMKDEILAFNPLTSARPKEFKVSPEPFKGTRNGI